MLFNKGVAKKAWISNKEIKKKEKQITAAQRWTIYCGSRRWNIYIGFQTIYVSNLAAILVTAKDFSAYQCNI